MLDEMFIVEHIDELVTLEDYVPLVSFIQYDKHHERENFLKSKKLLTTIHEMDQLIQEKCNQYEDTTKAWNSVIIEWLDLHPEFEKIISHESYELYSSMSKNKSYVEFIYLLGTKSYIPKEYIETDYNDDFSFKDDSKVKLPDFKTIENIYDQYENTLIADYLSYLV